MQRLELKHMTSKVDAHLEQAWQIRYKNFEINEEMEKSKKKKKHLLTKLETDFPSSKMCGVN